MKAHHAHPSFAADRKPFSYPRKEPVSCPTFPARVSTGETTERLRDSVCGFAADEVAPSAPKLIDGENLFPPDLCKKPGDSAFTA